MNGFYLLMECRHCDADMISDLCATTEVRDGMPVIPWDIATAETFICHNCGTRHDTSGDFDVHVEEHVREPVCHCGHPASAHGAGECWTSPEYHAHPNPKCECSWYAPRKEVPA